MIVSGQLGSTNDAANQISEYADQLRSWLGQAYEWQCMPFLMPPSYHHYSPILLAGAPAFSTQPTPNQNVPPSGGQASATGIRNNIRAQPNNLHNNQTEGDPVAVLGRIYEIPRLSKRLLAEVIDFGLLFFIKALITLMVLESWNLDDSNLFENEGNDEAEYELAMAITTNLLTIEFVHRILVVFYEVFMQYHQGGTPGKKTMGLRIISCSRCLPVGENRIMVFPATEINIWRSLGRAFMKNMGTALLFPTFLPMMVVQHNRTLYDIFCGTIVVESD